MGVVPSASPPRVSSRSFPRREAAGWRRIRRYAVPGWMIEQATGRRLAGDWRGACAAAGVDVTFDLAEVARVHGRPVASALEDDLRHLAPDLLRRLLAAGLDIDAADEDERTPLFVAVCEDAPPAHVRALLEAGARIDTIGKIHDEGVTLHRLIDWLGRSDLQFIADMIERDHPGLLEEE